MNPLYRAFNVVFNRRRWITHVVFWILVFLWYFFFFGRQNTSLQQTLFFTGLVMPVTMATVYFVNYFLLARYLLKGRYGLFILYFIYTLIISVFLEMLVSITTFYLMAEARTGKMSQASWDLFFIMTSLLAVVFLAMSVKLLLHWRDSREENQRLMLEKVEKELKFLKAQLNPHFLFNTLNNLYYLATQKSDLAPAAILQLSEILDYSLYSSREPFVPLDREWQQLQNYIALESLHYEDRLRLNCKLEGTTEGMKIAPMLLISLVENAFKHGIMQAKGQGWIDIAVVSDENHIWIQIANSISPNPAGNGGIGMENLKTQLNILYPSAHTLDISSGENVFKLNLSLNQR